MCQEKMILKSVPENYFCLQNHQNFIARQIFKFLFLARRSKNIFAGKGDLLIYFFD